MTTRTSTSVAGALGIVAVSALLAIGPALAAGGGGGGGGSSGGGGGSSGGGGGGMGGGGSGGGGSSGGGSKGGAGGSSAGNGGNGSMIRRPTDLTTCPSGQVWNTKKKSCMRSTSGVLPDDELTDYAFALAKAKRFDEALATLDMLQGPPTPKVWNYRGYATRKLGRLDEGIGYYLKSVSMDPNYAQVREYLGEAYVVKGRHDLASKELEAIKAICGTDCEEYEDLANAIAGKPEDS